GVVAPARRARAGPVPSPRRRPDAGDPGRAAAGPGDDRGPHAAVAAPQRPGDHVPAGHGAGGNAMSDKGQQVAIITGGSQGIGASLVTAYRRQGWSVVATARTMKPTEDSDVLTLSAAIPHYANSSAPRSWPR